MIRLSDYVVSTLASRGIRHVFMVTGGAAMHLNDAFGRESGIQKVYCDHEQSCAMAAESYFRVSNRIAAVNVTAGPGATNAITGVYGAHVDSMAMIVVSGHSKRLPFSPDLLELLKYPSIAVPRRGSEDIDRFLKPSGRYYVEYFVPPFDGIFTPDTGAEKIDVLKNTDVLLVPELYFQNMQMADKDLYGKGWSSFLTGLFLFPAHCPAVNYPFLQDAIIARYISSNFHPIGSFRDYLIFKHN